MALPAYNPPNDQSNPAAAIPVSIVGGGISVTEAPATAAFATTQATMGTSAALIVAARTGTSGTGRAAVTILNPLSVTCYVGNSGVTTATGFPIEPGAELTIQTQAAIYGVLPAGSGVVGVVESF